MAGAALTMLDTITPTTGYRYERKFVASTESFSEVENLALQHPLMFREVYQQRWVNNVYLDSFDRKALVAAVNGNSSRTKTRIRWYGPADGPVRNPVLELKIKRGAVGCKQVFAMRGFSLQPLGGLSRALQDAFQRSDLPPSVLFALQACEPVLLNRYLRRYYQATDDAYRLTMDRELQFSGTTTTKARSHRLPSGHRPIVVELKYPESEGAASADLPFRFSRISKYVTGMCLVEGHACRYDMGAM